MSTRFCRHIRINGERCGSPALTSEVFCYYHDEFGRRHRRVTPPDEPFETIIHPMTLQGGSQREPLTAEYSTVHSAAQLQLDFPPLEDRHSIQLALSMLITALAQDRLDPRRAAMLLYGLQVASANAKDLIPALPKHKRISKVRRTVLDTSSGTLIAPDEDPEDPEDDGDYERPGPAARYLEKVNREKEERDRKAAEAAIIPPLLPPA